MNLDELKAIVPADWLEQHREEYLATAEKIMKTIMMAEAANKGWSKPLRNHEDFEAFIASEAAERGLTESEVRRYLLDAGKIKARNHIFETHFVPFLPKDAEGRCTASKKVILRFIHETVDQP